MNENSKLLVGASLVVAALSALSGCAAELTDTAAAEEGSPQPVEAHESVGDNAEEAVSSTSQAVLTGTGQEIVISHITLSDDPRAHDQYIVWVTIRNPTPDAYVMPMRITTQGTTKVGWINYSWTHQEEGGGTFTAAAFKSVTYGIYMYGYGNAGLPLIAPARFSFSIKDLNSGVVLSGGAPPPCQFDARDSDFWWGSNPQGKTCYCDHYGTWQLTNFWVPTPGVIMDTFTCQ